MNCVCCNKNLPNMQSTVNQPISGTEFIGGGDYGSSVTDLPDIRFLINVCDVCIKRALENGTCIKRHVK